MIEWIVTSSALILLVLLLRVLIKDRISPRLRYALWALVLLRLLIPGTLWESRASVMTPVATQEAYRVVESIPRDIQMQEDGSAVVYTSENYGWEIMTTIPAEVVESGGPAFVDARDGTTASVAEKMRQMNICKAVLGGWLLGSAAVGAFLLAVNLKFYLNLKKRRRPAGEYRGRSVYVADGLSTPCLFGLFRPGIYLVPELEKHEKIHVLAHEYTHFRQGDHIWSILRGVCLALHWYNPLVWAAAVLSRRDCELSCDEGAVRLLGEEHRADYGRTLVGLVARRTTAADLACCATTMTGGKSALKERITLLVKQPRTTAVMAVLVTAVCVVFAVCTFTGAAEAEEPDTPAEPVQTVRDEIAEPDERLSIEPMRQEDYARAACRVIEEDLRSEGVQDCRINDLTVWEWRVDINSGDCQAVFGTEIMVLAEDQKRWMAGNTVAAQELEDPFYRDYDGWLVFWWTGYLVYDSQTSQWSIPVTATSGCLLDTIDEDLGLETGGRDYRRFHALPENLPTEFMDMSRPAEEQGAWLLLAEWPEADIALYRTNSDDSKVYLRYGEEFQMFEQDLSRLDMLPEIEKTEQGLGWGVAVSYLRHEGTYFNGETYEPGVVAEYVVYERKDGYWSENHFSTGRLESALPALEDLPTDIVTLDIPGAYMEPILLLAELPEDDIAIYYERKFAYSGSLIRYGDHLQRVREPLDGGGVYPPELYFEDLDDDGEKELAVHYNVIYDTDAVVYELVVYEWDGQKWAGHRPDLAKTVIEDFNANRTLTLSRDTGAAEISYLGSTVVVDMNAVYEEQGWPSDASHSCTLDELSYSYDWHRSGTVYLHIWGAVLADGYPADKGNILYTCAVTYHADGSFTIEDNGFGGLTTGYPYFALTPTFREILLDYISERQEALGGDISADRFAICDVNGDGRDELITQTNAAMMAGQVETVYDADGNTLLAEYPLMTYYDNGYAKAGWSHNQGVAGNTLWPYTLLKYDADAGKYVRVAAVDGWDKSVRDTYLSYDESIIPFPDDVDKDGDGFVYYVIEEEGGYAPVYGEPMDYAEYALWLVRYLGGNAVRVHYASLSKGNIALIQLNRGER